MESLAGARQHGACHVANQFRAFGDEDEFTGQRHAAVRLAPARQGFGAINLATRHIDDRLEERHELALPQTAAYLLGQCQMPAQAMGRSEEHTSELQSLMRISYAGLCL